ncbi:MAG: septation protein A [Ottowia sp.]|nr:septation protein A [Ottowia sp.]
MKFLFDLLPIVLFFVAYKMAGVYVATLTAMIASIIQIIWVWVKHRHVDPMLWVSCVLIVFFGGATLLFHNENFIKWKPSVLYWVLALGLMISAILFKKNLVYAAMSKHIVVPNTVWATLNWAWVGFFILMGVVNLYVAMRYPTDVWVNFKLFGSMGLTIAFVIVQSVWLSRYIQKNEHSDGY